MILRTTRSTLAATTMKVLQVMTYLLELGRSLDYKTVNEPVLSSSRDVDSSLVTLDNLPAVLDASIEDLVNGMSAGHFTSVDLVKTYLARIDEVQDALRAVIETAPDAVKTAQNLDRDRSKGVIHGPLHGIPILLKDNIATCDLLNTTSGATCLIGAQPFQDASVVKFLRRAGAIILGKANLSEWANFRSSSGNASAGWSARGGQTKGAYHEHQYPCGSSSGSAVAVSVALSSAAIGTETDGSITCPAGYNNVVSIKPTVGLTPRDLVIPGSRNQDTVGPFTRSVKDSAILLSAMSGYSESDNATARIPWTKIPDFGAACKASALKGKRIGIPRNLITGSDIVLEHFEKATDIFKRAGANLVDHANIETQDEFTKYDHDQVIMSDFRSGLADYFSQLSVNPHGIKTLQDVIEFTKNHPRDEEYPSRDIEGLLDAERSPEEDSEEYQKILQQSLRLAGQEGIIATLSKWNLDALVAPCLSVKATTMAAVAGFPIISVPMGFFPTGTPVRYDRRGVLVKEGPNIPMGLQIIGKSFDEENLIGIAYAFEQAAQIQNKVRPKILPRTELADVVARKLQQSDGDHRREEL